MSRNRIFFVIVVGLALAFVGVAFVAERLDLFVLPTRQALPIQVWVSPALHDWAEAAAADFESSRPGATVEIRVVDSLSFSDEFRRAEKAIQDGAADPGALPEAWLPEASFVVGLARAQANVPFEATGQPVAYSSLVWGAFASREQVLVQRLGALNWQTVHEAAVVAAWEELGGDPSWRFFKLVIASPTRSPEGLAALLAAAATYHNRPDLDVSDVNDPAFLAWLVEVVESVPSFNTLGPNPAQEMATRGSSIGDVGLLTEAAWRRSGLLGRQDFVTASPQFTLRLDYPYTLRTDLAPGSAERDLAEAFGRFLLQEAQAGLAEYGFEAAGAGASVGGAAQQVEVDGQVALTLLRRAEQERLGQ
ncbi:MAG: hypothetical protein ACE5H9_12825 [Anaerolineae bacterium]